MNDTQSKEVIVIRARSLARKASNDSNSALLLLGLYAYICIEETPDLELLKNIRMETKQFSEEMYFDLCYLHERLIDD